MVIGFSKEERGFIVTHGEKGTFGFDKAEEAIDCLCEFATAARHAESPKIEIPELPDDDDDSGRRNYMNKLARLFVQHLETKLETKFSGGGYPMLYSPPMPVQFSLLTSGFLVVVSKPHGGGYIGSRDGQSTNVFGSRSDAIGFLRSAAMKYIERAERED